MLPLFILLLSKIATTKLARFNYIENKRFKAKSHSLFYTCTNWRQF